LHSSVAQRQPGCALNTRLYCCSASFYGIALTMPTGLFHAGAGSATMRVQRGCLHNDRSPRPTHTHKHARSAGPTTPKGDDTRFALPRSLKPLGVHQNESTLVSRAGVEKFKGRSWIQKTRFCISYGTKMSQHLLRLEETSGAGLRQPSVRACVWVGLSLCNPLYKSSVARRRSDSV
jgi:hypothetical protein